MKKDLGLEESPFAGLVVSYSKEETAAFRTLLEKVSSGPKPIFFDETTKAKLGTLIGADFVPALEEEIFQFHFIESTQYPHPRPSHFRAKLQTSAAALRKAVDFLTDENGEFVEAYRSVVSVRLPGGEKKLKSILNSVDELRRAMLTATIALEFHVPGIVWSNGVPPEGPKKGGPHKNFHKRYFAMRVAEIYKSSGNRLSKSRNGGLAKVLKICLKAADSHIQEPLDLLDDSFWEKPPKSDKSKIPKKNPRSTHE